MVGKLPEQDSDQWAGTSLGCTVVWEPGRGVYTVLATYGEGLLVFKLNTGAGKVVLCFGDTFLYAVCTQHMCVCMCVFIVLPRKS